MASVNDKLIQMFEGDINDIPIMERHEDLIYVNKDTKREYLWLTDGLPSQLGTGPIFSEVGKNWEDQYVLKTDGSVNKIIENLGNEAHTAKEIFNLLNREAYSVSGFFVDSIIVQDNSESNSNGFVMEMPVFNTENSKQMIDNHHTTVTAPLIKTHIDSDIAMYKEWQAQFDLFKAQIYEMLNISNQLPPTDVIEGTPDLDNGIDIVDLSNKPLFTEQRTYTVPQNGYVQGSQMVPLLASLITDELLGAIQINGSEVYKLDRGLITGLLGQYAQTPMIEVKAGDLITQQNLTTFKFYPKI